MHKCVPIYSNNYESNKSFGKLFYFSGVIIHFYIIQDHKEMVDYNLCFMGSDRQV